MTAWVAEEHLGMSDMFKIDFVANAALSSGLKPRAEEIDDGDKQT